MTIRFADIAPARPTPETLAAARARIDALLDSGARAEAIAAWDADRRAYEDWSALVHLRFAQDTTSAVARADREAADALAPVALGHEVAIKRRLLADPDRDVLVAEVGAHAVALWETDVTTFDPAIAADLETEASLAARYTELLAGAAIPFEGETLNLSGLAPYAEDPDRARRHAAEAARWDFFAANGEALDGIYDDLVRLRTRMARALGDANYVKLGYRRMRRTDYGPDEVARYRAAVRAHVVPLVAELLEARRVRHDWERLRFWDEALIDAAGNPKPAFDHDGLLDRAGAMFEGTDPRLGAFWAEMRAGGFLDLRNRPGKAGGGFCTSFPSVGQPFIFANFNGTHHDIAVFTHEMGHAFQNHASRDAALVDYLWPTMEAAEINSMGLEFLTYPRIGALVGEDAAERFRRMHLEASLAFLPYGVCVDHFQHEVYENPDVGPAERHAMWQRLERLYMPWTDYGDLAYPAMGGRWQAKPHIYRSPFYYIDYTLALACAMQLWLAARRDERAAVETYVALCARGGSAPFGALVASAGLTSPFADGALEGIVAEARRVLMA